MATMVAITLRVMSGAFDTLLHHNRLESPSANESPA